MVIIEVAGQQPFEMAFVEHDHVVQTVASDAADQSFNEGILPRTARCGAHLVLLKNSITPLHGDRSLTTRPVDPDVPPADLHRVSFPSAQSADYPSLDGCVLDDNGQDKISKCSVTSVR